MNERCITLANIMVSRDWEFPGIADDADNLVVCFDVLEGITLTSAQVYELLRELLIGGYVESIHEEGHQPRYRMHPFVYMIENLFVLDTSLPLEPIR